MNEIRVTVAIVGGGAAGISVAANLRRRNPSIEVAIVEPSELHYYQPAFTLVGGGEFNFGNTVRAEASLIPRGVQWIKDHAERFEPENNAVVLRSGQRLGYEYLVVCPGIQLDWHKIAGLTETLGRNGVCSNYSPQHVQYTWECIRNFAGGTALFTQPPVPIKCAGAPQKIAYLAADRWRRRGILAKANMQFLVAGAVIFSVPLFARELEEIAAGYGINVAYNTNLVAVEGAARTAIFEQTAADGTKETLTMKFDMLHVTPPQSAPDFIKQSPLANGAGWVEVNDNTCQHVRYANVYSLGDASSLPTSKTAAAVRKQVPVVVKNILAALGREPINPAYDGYTSCPLTTSLNSVLLAEFAYAGKVTPSFPLDPRRPRLIWWWMKKYGLPRLYWDYMLKGLDWDIPHRASYMDRFLKARG